jgi:hypothetical protein
MRQGRLTCRRIHECLVCLSGPRESISLRDVCLRCSVGENNKMPRFADVLLSPTSEPRTQKRGKKKEITRQRFGTVTDRASFAPTRSFPPRAPHSQILFSDEPGRRNRETPTSVIEVLYAQFNTFNRFSVAKTLSAASVTLQQPRRLSSVSEALREASSMIVSSEIEKQPAMKRVLRFGMECRVLACSSNKCTQSERSRNSSCRRAMMPFIHL